MASSSRDSNILTSSDDETLHKVEKRKRKTKNIISSDSEDDDSDFEIKPKRAVKPLHCESDSEFPCDDSVPNNFTSDFTSLTNFSNENISRGTEEDSAIVNDFSDNEQSEKCAICLSKFSGQDKATPESCDHTFCLECLQEWAKKVNTCPIDRLKFNLILIRHHKEDKIFKRISVENPERFIVVESDSSDSTYCELCGDCDNESTLLLCDECEHGYHCECLNPPLESVPHGPWFCPDCAAFIRLQEKLLSDFQHMIQGRFRSSALTSGGISRSPATPLQNTVQHSSSRRAYLRRYENGRRVSQTPHLGRYFLQNSYFSSSDSSEDDVERSSHDISRCFQAIKNRRLNRMSSHLGSSLRRKLMREMRNISTTNNNNLFSSATSVAETGGLLSTESDDDYNALSYESGGPVMTQSVTSSRPPTIVKKFCPRDSVTSKLRESPPAFESDNYDLVGSILQNQTILHHPRVTVQRNASCSLSGPSIIEQQLSLTSSTSTADVSGINITETKSPLSSLVFIHDNSTLEVDSSNISGQQRPLNPMQKTASKYGNMPKQAPSYSCGASTSTVGGSALYDMNTISRTTHSNSSHERYGGSSHSVSSHRSLSSCSVPDDVKKDHRGSASLKDSGKSHSEDEVDIYSDIESVCDEEAVISDKVEPMKIDFKCDESQLSNMGDGTDSSDNELVIDEDVHAEEENERLKDSTQSSVCKKDGDFPPTENNDTSGESEESNGSSMVHSDREHQQAAETNLEDGPFYATRDNSCENDSSPLQGNESSQELFQCENSSPSTDKQKESRFEEISESENEVGAQESDVDMEVYEDNSVDSAKKSFRTDCGTPCSSKSSPKPCMEDHKSGEFESQCGNSASSENPGFENNNAFSESQNENVVEDEQSKQVMEPELENSNDSVYPTEENENNSIQSFDSDAQNVDVSEPEDSPDVNAGVQMETDDAQEDEAVPNKGSISEPDTDIPCDASVKSDDGSIENYVDSPQGGSTPNLDETSPCQNERSTSKNENTESIEHEFESSTKNIDNQYELKDSNLESNEISDSENENRSLGQPEAIVQENNEASVKDVQELEEERCMETGVVDLGIEDISEAGSEDLNDDDYNNDNPCSNDTEAKKRFDDVEKEMENLFAKSECEDNFVKDHCNKDNIDKNLPSGEHNRYLSISHHSNHSFEEHEEGEIIEERPMPRKDRKRGTKQDRCHEDSEDYGDLAPRVNISDLPRIPKIKRDREKNDVPEEISLDSKRTSVLGRVDLGGGDISWKRLSKHTRERSYRDGRPKDERLLYRERESRSKDKKNSNENDRRCDNKGRDGERRREDKKQDAEKSKNEYDRIRERKSDKNKDTEKSKALEWGYSAQDKHEKHEKRKSHKDKYSKDKEKYSKDKDKKEKDRYDKNRYSKDEDKYDRDKIKDEGRYEREVSRYDREEERFERVVYEKGKFKEKEHKNKHKDRKCDGTKSSSKDRSREKHKHIHSNDHFSEKQKEREVRKVDDKLKIVVEQKESRKDKADKRADKKDQKHDKKHREESRHHEHRKKERVISPYTEHAPLESKEIFAKGDSIIINVNFNRASPKEILVSEDNDVNCKEKKLTPEDVSETEGKMVIDEVKIKTKRTLSEKNRNLIDMSLNKRPTTPPERNTQVLSISECFWQETDETDANSLTPEKSVEGSVCIEEEEDTIGSADAYDVDNNYSDSNDSTDLPETQPVVQTVVHEMEQSVVTAEKATDFQGETETFTSSRRRSPRSPSPPSPVDNDSYDPCEPTKSPSPPPIPPAPPLPTSNPKPPPSPELPPLPPEPEPTDGLRDDPRGHKQNTTCPSSDFMAVTTAMVSPVTQPIVMLTQTTVANPMSMTNMLLPPPSFLSHTTSSANNVQTIPPLIPPRNFNFQLSGHPHPPMLFPPNHVQQVIRGNFVPAQMHAANSMPPPPNAPGPHMGAVPPPPPPPPNTISMISQVRHPQIHGPLPPNSLLQNITMVHPVNLPQIQMTHLHHLTQNLANSMANHHSPMISQNQPTSLPVTIHNQQVVRSVLPQSQIPNNTLSMQNPGLVHMQSQNNNLNQALHSQILAAVTNTVQKTEKQPRHSSPIEKNEVVDMEVDSPYSPGDSPSLDSGCDYSPTCSPVPTAPKVSNTVKDTFDSLLPSDQKRNHAEKTKFRSDSKNTDTPNKKARLDGKADSGNKVRHSVRMQLADKSKGSSRKEQKQAEKKELSKLDDSQLKILDELPSSAVEMQVKEKFLKKLNRQERVVEEVKLALKPYYKSRNVSKDEYKDILRKSVPKICHNKSGEINPVKVKYLVECYVKKIKHARKKSGKSRKSSKFS